MSVGVGRALPTHTRRLAWVCASAAATLLSACVVSSPSTSPPRTHEPAPAAVVAPPAVAKPRPVTNVRRTSAAETRPRRPATAAVPEGTAIVYVSQWCMHCTPVTEQLRELGIPFVERDIFDTRYRAEYAEKMRSIGRRPPSVPLVEFHDRLVLGLDNTSLSILSNAVRSGRSPLPEQEHAGATTPPTPRKHAHRAGGPALPEPPDSTAILYVSRTCDHCPAARAFLRNRGIPFVERDIKQPQAADQLEALHLVFHESGQTVPSFEVLGRSMIGFDDDAIDATLAWRRATSGPTVGRR